MKRHFSLFLFCLALLPALAPAQGYKPSGAAPGETIYIFGVHPYTNPQELYAAYEPIMRYLEQKVPGTVFQVEASKDYPDYEAKLKAGRFAFSLPNPAQTLTAIASGYRVIAKMTPDEDFRGLIVARADAKIPDAAALTGRKLCFPSPTAVAGTMLPLLYLHENGMDVSKTPISYVGSQFSSILNAYTGEYAACGSTSRFYRIWSRDNPDKAQEMKVVWRTPSLPHNAVVARKDVPKAVAQRVAEVLAGMDKDPNLDQSQFKADQQHFEMATDANYTPMREFLNRYDKAIGVPASMKQGPK